MIKRFKHSGTLGDLIYSMAIVKHFGGGEFYLHLNQIDWIGQHYYGSPPNPFHQGRMTPKDYQFMESFMLAQPNITAFKTLDPKTTEITHNLDLFRPLFVGHPGNYVDCYCEAFAIRDQGMRDMIRTTPWLKVPEPKTIEGKSYVINRTARWSSPDSLPAWLAIRDQAGDAAIFVGLPEEYAAFKQFTDWDIAYHPTETLLDLAAVIAGAEQFVGNQSAALSLAIGLGTPYACELRRDLPQERNECWFPNQPNGEYF
jgi:hypothetical protein